MRFSELWTRRRSLTRCTRMADRKSPRSPGPLRLSLPATSANLGPAFDAAALAMDFHLKLEARPSAKFSITATGRDLAICRARDNHPILNTYHEVLQAEGGEVTPL